MFEFPNPLEEYYKDVDDKKLVKIILKKARKRELTEAEDKFLERVLEEQEKYDGWMDAFDIPVFDDDPRELLEREWAEEMRAEMCDC